MIKKYTTELSELLASKHNLQKKEAREFVTAFIETINEGLEKDGVVRIKGLGYFKITTIKPRKSVNVSTGESVIIESHKKVTFTPDPAIKELVNKPFSIFDTVTLKEGVDFNDLTEIDKDDNIEDLVFTEEAEDGRDHEPIEETEERLDYEISESTEKTEEERKSNITDTTKETEEEIDNEPNDPYEKTEDQEQLDDNGEHENQPYNETLDNNIEETIEEPDNTPTLENEVPQEETENIVNLSSTDYQEVNPSSQSISNDDDNPTSNRIPNDDDDDVSTLNSITINNDNKDVSETESETLENNSPLLYSNNNNITTARALLYVFCSILILAIGFAAGYILGRGYLDQWLQPSAKKPTEKIIMVSKPVSTISKKNIVRKNNSKTIEKTTDKNGFNYDKVNNDPRVKSGAYNIIGIDTILILKEGQSMRGYCNATLGSGMLCYFQALNDTTELSAGDTMKVPKVKVK